MDIRQNPYAIIALGGYGRQEQCIRSDVDLLFLFKKSGSLPSKKRAMRFSVFCRSWFEACL
jgi:[protein-PII] uridylyltransferase